MSFLEILCFWWHLPVKSHHKLEISNNYTSINFLNIYVAKSVNVTKIGRDICNIICRKFNKVQSMVVNTYKLFFKELFMPSDIGSKYQW